MPAIPSPLAALAGRESSVVEVDCGCTSSTSGCSSRLDWGCCQVSLATVTDRAVIACACRSISFFIVSTNAAMRAVISSCCTIALEGVDSGAVSPPSDQPVPVSHPVCTALVNAVLLAATSQGIVTWSCCSAYMTCRSERLAIAASSRSLHTLFTKVFL
eukprot:3646250-Rhodomonas_salina.2